MTRGLYNVCVCVCVCVCVYEYRALMLLEGKGGAYIRDTGGFAKWDTSGAFESFTHYLDFSVFCGGGQVCHLGDSIHEQ